MTTFKHSVDDSFELKAHNEQQETILNIISLTIRNIPLDVQEDETRKLAHYTLENIPVLAPHLTNIEQAIKAIVEDPEVAYMPYDSRLKLCLHFMKEFIEPIVFPDTPHTMQSLKEIAKTDYHATISTPQFQNILPHAAGLFRAMYDFIPSRQLFAHNIGGTGTVDPSTAKTEEINYRLEKMLESANSFGEESLTLTPITEMVEIDVKTIFHQLAAESIETLNDTPINDIMKIAYDILMEALELPDKNIETFLDDYGIESDFMKERIDRIRENSPEDAPGHTESSSKTADPTIPFKVTTDGGVHLYYALQGMETSVSQGDKTLTLHHANTLGPTITQTFVQNVDLALDTLLKHNEIAPQTAEIVSSFMATYIERRLEKTYKNAVLNNPEEHFRESVIKDLGGSPSNVIQAVKSLATLYEQASSFVPLIGQLHDDKESNQNKTFKIDLRRHKTDWVKDKADRDGPLSDHAIRAVRLEGMVNNLKENGELLFRMLSDSPTPDSLAKDRIRSLEQIAKHLASDEFDADIQAQAGKTDAEPYADGVYSSLLFSCFMKSLKNETSRSHLWSFASTSNPNMHEITDAISANFPNRKATVTKHDGKIDPELEAAENISPYYH